MLVISPADSVHSFKQETMRSEWEQENDWGQETIKIKDHNFVIEKPEENRNREVKLDKLGSL